MTAIDNDQPGRVAIVGTYSPRKCGIATFTHDLRTALAKGSNDVQYDVVAIDDEISSPDYPQEVKWKIRQNCPADYTAIAEQLNRSGVDVISLQHEFGIFGGDAGEYLLLLLRATSIPVVTTFHTLLLRPNCTQRLVMDEICQRSSKLVVMSQKGVEILRLTYGVPESKIVHTHHGVHDLPTAPNRDIQTQLDVNGKKILLTFGLVSPDKGIETAIAAIPKIVYNVPDAVYCIVGETHPHIRRNDGEEYRDKLVALVDEFDVGDNVRFLNEYVDLEKLGGLLSLADVYVTPYLKPEQITSGTLAYALGSGRAIVSTPYWYAEELLADERGVLVPFRDPGAIADASIRLLTDDSYRSEVQGRARKFGKDMSWNVVAEHYLQSFAEAIPDVGSYKPSRQAARVESTVLCIRHLEKLTDCTGILQHAIYDIPLRSEGYCLDDNARALLLTSKLVAASLEDTSDIRNLRDRYLSFVYHAFNDDRGRFHNFMSYDRRWLEEAGSEDSHGRAIWALGQFVAESPFEGSSRLASDLLRRALPVLQDFTSPRAWAYAMIGLTGMLKAGENDYEVVGSCAQLCDRLHGLLVKVRRPDWNWFEDVLSYANARLPQALMAGGSWMGRSDIVDDAEEALLWLDSVQRSLEGRFEPIGSDHPYLRGGRRPRFAQQPVDVHASVSACIEAANVTGDQRWLERAGEAYAWFLGRNALGVPMYDAETAAGFDGLDADGINQNRGAESTLSFLLAAVELQAAGGKAIASAPQYAYLR